MPIFSQMDSIQLQVPKIEINPHGFDSLQYYQDPLHENVSLEEHLQLDNLFEFNSIPLEWDQNQHPHMGFQGFEDLGSWDFMLDNTDFTSPCDYVVVDEKPVTTMVDSFDYSKNPTSDLDEASRMADWGSNGIYNKKKSAALELDEIQKYFDLPITQAAKKLNVGLTVLKRRCRELKIMRWPHRKIKSLKALIENVKGLGLTNELKMLEEQKRLLEQLPDMELTERAKKLRQASFKANYKMKRSLTNARP
ncbi:PREDICTED: protein RKD4 [Prunus mume]|uniref:Protein RKD4 n=1 Tax=Prunus mume TaxID=102107 RepID=A0ABM0P622_PRUMU|nr:PREDICTED: protein RKD4 [Prunus mume]